MEQVKPSLVIMAAGMGSRYGGLKQIDPIDEQGHIIIDFSIYDAIEAGFKKIIFIIKNSIEKDFKEIIGNRISKFIDVEFVFQEIDKIPSGFSVPDGRVKPWGTGHAILCCKDAIDGPFGVINADDYYGKDAFKVLYDYLVNSQSNEFDYSMVGYILENTLTDNGHVARGVCSVSEDNYLIKIDERLRIEKRPDGSSAFTEDDGASWTTIQVGSTVSMNMFGFQKSLIKILENGFPPFLTENLKTNPLKCEYLLPTIVGELLGENKLTVKVLKSSDKWYGVTYKEDKQKVIDAMKALKQAGVYPKKLWENK